MPGFVNPDEQESRQELYRDLLTHLNTTIWGSPSTLPHSESGQYTLDMNPVEAFDKSKNPEGAIYAEPNLNYTEAIAKTDAVKMLAKGAKEAFGHILRTDYGAAFEGSARDVLALKSQTLRANVRDIIRSARRTPQELLTPLSDTEIVPIAEKEVLGRYWPKGSPGGAGIEVDPSKGGLSANTWFHEVIHGRHIDAPFYAKPTDQMTAGDVYKRYLELITKQTADVGESAASKTGKRFYWDNPKELVARDFASRATKIPPEFTDDPTLMEHTYTQALESTVARMQSRAPNLTKRMADRIKMDMRKQFPGLDWEDIVRKVGKDRPRVGVSYEGIEDTPLSEINPKWWEKGKGITEVKTFPVRKKINTYAAEE